MISNDDCSTDGKSLYHNTGNKGSMSTVRVGSRSLPMYPLVIVCLGLLNTVLLLAAVVIGIYCGVVNEEDPSHHITTEMLSTEVKQLQIMQSEANKAVEEVQKNVKKEMQSHQNLKLQIEQSKILSDDLQRQIETLQVEQAVLQASSSDISDSCGRCPFGWFLLNTTCYFLSNSETIPLKSWPDSRTDCIHRGADLVVINNFEEQVNLYEFLPKVASGQPWWGKGQGVWIGFTDIQTEGTWAWVNNVTQLDQGYWIDGEPNNHGILGEHCAATVKLDRPTKTWYDASCENTKQWLCEMAPNNKLWSP
ncbi:CD209 antigen-like protein E isoform X2 [Scomber scombrus]|uniref:CD209 antigen-like protein E isoform X2 n=1 Tax=Scomber scombrus TaxID=13677 RepID=A0AAV1ND04_SCOSC|nr:CD209 antigen-like protein 2 isoform X2 [Scomber scombrus]